MHFISWQQLQFIFITKEQIQKKWAVFWKIPGDQAATGWDGVGSHQVVCIGGLNYRLLFLRCSSDHQDVHKRRPTSWTEHWKVCNQGHLWLQWVSIQWRTDPFPIKHKPESEVSFSMSQWGTSYKSNKSDALSNEDFPQHHVTLLHFSPNFLVSSSSYSSHPSPPTAESHCSPRCVWAGRFQWDSAAGHWRSSSVQLQGQRNPLLVQECTCWSCP